MQLTQQQSHGQILPPTSKNSVASTSTSRPSRSTCAKCRESYATSARPSRRRLFITRPWARGSSSTNRISPHPLLPDRVATTVTSRFTPPCLPRLFRRPSDRLRRPRWRACPAATGSSATTSTINIPRVVERHTSSKFIPPCPRNLCGVTWTEAGRWACGRCLQWSDQAQHLDIRERFIWRGCTRYPKHEELLYHNVATSERRNAQCSVPP